MVRYEIKQGLTVKYSVLIDSGINSNRGKIDFRFNREIMTDNSKFFEFLRKELLKGGIELYSVLYGGIIRGKKVFQFETSILDSKEAIDVVLKSIFSYILTLQ